MIFRIFFATLLAQLPFIALAQTIVAGRVVDAETGRPLENVSVYFNETQIGTKTNMGGRFFIETSAERAKLVISCVGYQKVILDEVPRQNLKVLLKPINNTLKEVIISDRMGWQKWGSLFTKLLMSDDSHDYYSQKYGTNIVLNPKVISFYFDRDENVLTASSTEPIWIINDRLGYLIKVELDEFKYYIDTERLKYRSTLFFEPTKSSYPLDNIQLATNYAYQGSTSHFFSSLIKRTLSEEGFGTFKYSQVKNQEKARVIKLINKLKNEQLNNKQITINVTLDGLVKNKDSLKYYIKVLATSDYLTRNLDSVNIYQFLQKDSINNVFLLNLKDTLMITYVRHQKTLAKHTDYINIRRDRKEWITVETLMHLNDDQPLVISNTGNPLSVNWFVNGFMSSKRLSSALPADFDPELPRVKARHDALKNHAIFRDERP